MQGRREEVGARGPKPGRERSLGSITQRRIVGLLPIVRDHVYHPAFRGRKVLHDRDQVLALNEDEQTVFITLRTKYENRKAGLTDVFADGSMTAGAAYDGKVDGFDVASRAFAMADDAGNKTMGLVAFVDYEGTVIAMVALGPDATWVAHADMLAQTFGSFARIADPRLAGVEPPRIHTVLLERVMTIDELQKRPGVVVDAPTLAILNGVTPTASLPEGWRIKLPLMK